MAGMKRKWMSIGAVALLFAPLCVFLWSLREPPEREVLSELPDQQILEFLVAYEIEIPDEIKSVENYVDGIRIWIARTEKNPAVRFQYGGRVLHDLSNEIKKAVNDYYGVFP